MLRFLSYLAVALAVGCTRPPEQVHRSPELKGRITRARTPLVGAEVGVTKPTQNPTVSCARARARDITDSAGDFSVPADKDWVLGGTGAGAESRERWTLCVRERGARAFTAVFRAPAERWDTLEVSCDLDRAWLAPDRHGSEGRCLAQVASVAGEQIAMRRAGPLPATCDTTTTLIEPMGIGPVRVMGRVPELRRLCPSLRDSLVETEGWGITTRDIRHVLVIAGEPVIIEKSQGIVYGIQISSPKFSTREGIRVGSPAKRLLRLRRLRVVNGKTLNDPWMFAFQGPDCGLRYELSRPSDDFEYRHSEPVVPENLLTWPDSTIVRRIHIGFCPESWPGLRELVR